MIIREKAREKEELCKGIVDKTALPKVAQALGIINLVGRYIWAISNADVDATKKLGLTDGKKY